MSAQDQVRYGVFLLPDAQTSAAVTTITTFLRAQYGLVSAGRFPPHVTLAGSLALAVDETTLLETVAAIAARHAPVEVVNLGPRPLGFGIAFDVQTDEGGAPNVPLVDLAADVGDAVRPLLGPHGDLAPDVHARDAWHGHLSLASHDLIDRPDLQVEVEEFLADLDSSYPATFLARWLAVYRQHHRDWSARWWNDFRWEHLRSFGLSGQR